MTIELSKSDITFIQNLPVCRLATTSKDCEPRVRPVWSAFDGKHIYIATDPGTVKLQHLEKNSNVSIVFDDYDKNNWSNLKGIRIQGTAQIAWKGEEYRYGHELLKNKYPEYRTKEGGWKEGEIPILIITPSSIGKWANGEWAEKTT